MEHVRFLCLAVSRRESGNCIAGLDIDSGKWLRPIRSKARHAFADADLIVIDNHTHQSRFMAPLDLIDVPVEDCAASHSQPENWVVSPAFLDSPPEVLRRCTGKRTVEFLLKHLEGGEFVLHGPRDHVHVDEIATGPLDHSLCLVHPAKLAWKVCPNAKHVGKLQVRAEFRFGNTPYSLVVTDPVWEERCRHARMGIHEHGAIATPGCDLTLLTISLAAVPYHSLHYKLVAGVIELSTPGASA